VKAKPGAECQTRILDKFVCNTGHRRPYDVQVVEHILKVNGLPKETSEVTFVHLSDIHAGYGGTEPVYEETIRRVNEINPDYLLVTGDYIDDHAPDEHALPDLLHRITPRFNTFVSLGNHDHRRGVSRITRMLERSGVCVLNNGNVHTGRGLWIAGVDDYYEGKPNVEKAFRGIPEGVTSVLLSHNPTIIDFIKQYDTIQLSGHTHGGQIAVPFPNPRIVVKLHLRCDYVAGWYTHGKAKLYVSKGLGVTGKPFRINCPAEIGLFRLQPK
jgi:uncharacterized protein